MAAEGPLQELCEETSCSICLDFFRDPVMIPECGHNFCRDCLVQSWGDSRGPQEASCPQCRGITQPNSLRPNQQLANVVEIAKKFQPSEGKRGEDEGRVCKKPLELFCQTCSRSLEHKDHQVDPPKEAAGEKVFGAAGKGSVCQKHQEPLKLFCKDDEALICVVCDRSKEHRNHETLPLEEASQEYKDQFYSCLEILKTKREQTVVWKGKVEKESQDLLEQTEAQKQDTVVKFKKLHAFLEEQEKHLLAQMEEVEKEVARNRDQHLARLTEELSSLDSLIREMKGKCEQPAGDLLQHAKSTLERYKEKESFKNPVAFPLDLKWRIWDCADLNHLFEGIKKQIKDTVECGLHLQKASVTLDPDTAHRRLLLSGDQKSMRRGEKSQSLPDNPERFDSFYAVLGCEGFTGGRHFWEVLVGREEGWMVGVARKSVRRKGEITFSPERGFWAVRKCGGRYWACVKSLSPPLTLSGELKRIRVCLNYAGGRVAFYDADRAALLYEFSGASFSGETLLPFFWVHQKGHLQISS